MPGIGATARDFTGEIRARLLEECDYRLEAERHPTPDSNMASSSATTVDDILERVTCANEENAWSVMCLAVPGKKHLVIAVGTPAAT